MDARAQLIGGWMARQRWFAGKGGVPRLRELAELTLPTEDADATVRLLLYVDEGSPRRPVYQVPVVERRAVAAGAEEHLIGADAGHALLDGPHDPALAGALLAAMGRTDAVTASRVLSGEQSNTSIIVGTAAGELMLKVFRVVQHGVNPDVELQAALSGTGSDAVARFAGGLEAEWPAAAGEPVAGTDADGVTVAQGSLAIAQEFLRGSEDAWRVARRAVDDGRDFRAEAAELGRTTAEIHRILAAQLPTVAPDDDRRAAIAGLWRRRLEEAIHDVPALAEHRADIEAVYRDAEAAAWPMLQRIHGDLHLGQILLAAPDDHPGAGRRWVFIDFEGEPLRSIAERVAPEPAARDVAGMLRSFDYAAAASEHPDAAAWRDACTAAYLDGYAAAVEELPAPALLTAFALDKAVYEASYEARNRPAWVGIPVAAIARLARPAHA